MTREEYIQYLEGEHWKTFSRRIKKERFFQCERCRMDEATSKKKYRQGLNVHHKTYKNIGKEKPADVIVLCWACHMGEHGKEHWVKAVERFSMPEVKPLGCTYCANCNKPSRFDLWNADEFDQVWVCEDCR